MQMSGSEKYTCLHRASLNLPFHVTSSRVPLTWRMLYSTTSSAEGSVASNLHWVIASAVTLMASLSPTLALPMAALLRCCFSLHLVFMASDFLSKRCVIMMLVYFPVQGILCSCGSAGHNTVGNLHARQRVHIAGYTGRYQRCSPPGVFSLK